MANRRDPHTFCFGNALSATANGDSEPIIARHLKNVVVQIDGTFVATVSVRTRVESTLSFIEIAAVTAKALVPIPNDAAVHDVMLVVSGYVSGSLTGTLVGRTSQE